MPLPICHINNTTGTGSVTITGGDFSSSSSGSGLVVQSRGAITLTDIYAPYNTGDGIYLDNSSAPSAQPVTIKSSTTERNNTVSGNNGYGLCVLIPREYFGHRVV